MRNLLSFFEGNPGTDFAAMRAALDGPRQTHWVNLGGQLLPAESYRQIISRIEDGSIGSWDSLHSAYREIGDRYHTDRACHALGALLSLHDIDIYDLSESIWKEWISRGIALQEQTLSRTIESRSKDYRSSFRKMMYDSENEMNEVLGKLDDSPFIAALEQETEQFKHLAGAHIGTPPGGGEDAIPGR